MLARTWWIDTRLSKWHSRVTTCKHVNRLSMNCEESPKIVIQCVLFCHLRHPRKEYCSSSQALASAKALERALRMCSEKRPYKFPHHRWQTITHLQCPVITHLTKAQRPTACLRPQLSCTLGTTVDPACEPHRADLQCESARSWPHGRSGTRAQQCCASTALSVTGRDRGTGQVGSVLTEQGPGQYHDSAQSGSIHPWQCYRNKLETNWTGSLVTGNFSALWKEKSFS